MVTAGEGGYNMRVLGTIIMILLAGVLPAVCEEGHDVHGEETTHHEDGGHAFKHEIALFLGVTDEKGHDIEGTWGIEYAYSLSPKLQLGGILEYAGGALRNTILVMPLYWKPVGGLIFLAGPGVEFHKGRGDDQHHLFKSGGETDRDETYFLFRLGTAYTFHVGSRYSIIPSISLDLVEGEKVWVGGVSFGVMF